MIASPTRQDDLETYTIWLELYAFALRSYKREPTPEKEQNIKEMEEFRLWLKNKIDTYDYTEDDKRLNNWLKWYHSVIPKSG